MYRSASSLRYKVSAQTPSHPLGAPPSQHGEEHHILLTPSARPRWLKTSSSSDQKTKTKDPELLCCRPGPSVSMCEQLITVRLQLTPSCSLGLLSLSGLSIASLHYRDVTMVYCWEYFLWYNSQAKAYPTMLF